MSDVGISATSKNLATAIILAGSILQNNSGDLESTKREFEETTFSHLWDEISHFLIPIKDDGGATISDSSAGVKNPDPWYSDPSPEDDSYWHRYVDLLLRKGWESAINDIRTSTRDLIDRLPDPKGEPLDVYGLVVGRVQSGKTANFTGLIARAVDSGYNLIIVMSGTLNNLRDQTQSRLLRELTGHLQHPRGYHVERPENLSNEIELLTNIGDDDDFKGADEDFLDGARPMLAVVKKNVIVLEKLHKWLSSTTKKQRDALKLLVIDDESDYGSVNTNRKRAKTESLQQEEEVPEESKSEKEASKTNAYVRGILNLFPTRAYLGYTATPYANVMIDPSEDEAEFDFGDGKGPVSLQKTLYPRNFIRLLSKTPGYVGLGEIFPPTTANNHVVEVSTQEANTLRNDIIEEITPGLKTAIIDFITSGVMKKESLGIEKWEKTHHTMMVHTTHSVSQMGPLAKLIDNTIKGWSNLIWDDFDQDHDEFVTLLRESWSMGSDEEFDKEKIAEFFNDIQATILVNSEKDEGVKADQLNPNLDFESSRVVGVIVGGNLLSRGLTVEGLTISYFVRPAATYDTAIQMCRWNGIRSELERRLIRVYLTRQMKEDYQWMNLVESDLRDEIRHYHSTGLTPSDFAIRILMHQVEGRKRLQPSSRNKMAAVVRCDRGIHRSVQQARGFFLDDAEIMVRNSDSTLQFLTEIGMESILFEGKKSGHFISRGVTLDSIEDWLSEMRFPQRGFNQEGLMGYFSYMKSEFPENLRFWSVVLVGRGQGSALHISKGISIRMPTRAKNSDLGISDLAIPRHMSLDLPGHPERFMDENGNFPRPPYFDKRAEDNPALILYLLDPNYKNSDPSTDFFPSEVENRPDCIVAPAFLLPRLTLDEEQRKDLISYYRLEQLPGSGR